MIMQGTILRVMTEHYDKIRINLVGVGYMIQKSRVSNTLFNKMVLAAQKLNSSLDEALLDVEFFSVLDFPKISTISDFQTEFCYHGLLDDPRSKIEIWMNGKKKKVLKVRQLYNEDLLFPLYDSKIFEANLTCRTKREFVFVEVSIGTVLDVSVNIPDFSADKLLFKICEVENGIKHSILFDVLYEGKTLFVRIPDTLVTSYNVFLKG